MAAKSGRSYEQMMQALTKMVRIYASFSGLVLVPYARAVLQSRGVSRGCSKVAPARPPIYVMVAVTLLSLEDYLHGAKVSHLPIWTGPIDRGDVHWPNTSST